MTNIEGEKYIDINPYLHALEFFKKIDQISSEYKKNIYNVNRNIDSPRQLNSLNKYIDFFKNNCITINEEDNDEKIREKNKFYQSPEKIFDYLLDSLHNIFINKENEEKKTYSPESDQKIALKIFEDFDKKNNSCIKDLFFGKKIIIKTCSNCYTTYYLYKYLKTIHLNIRENEINCDLETCLDHIQRTYDGEFLCPMCSVKQAVKISIKILEKPEFLIIVISEQNKHHIRVPLFIYNDCYKLIAAEVTEEKKKSKCWNIFNILCKMCIKSKGKLLFNDIEGRFDLINGETLTEKPYVLFYKKMENDVNNKNYKEYDFSNVNLVINKNEEENEINNNIHVLDVNSNEELLDKKYKNMCNTIDKKNNNNNNNNSDSNNDTNLDDKSDICLYFRFESNQKEIFIDTDDCQTFKQIVEKLMAKYNYEYNVDENNLFCNNKKIDCQKTPKQLHIPDESRITIR